MGRRGTLRPIVLVPTDDGWTCGSFVVRRGESRQRYVILRDGVVLARIKGMPNVRMFIRRQLDAAEPRVRLLGAQEARSGDPTAKTVAAAPPSVDSAHRPADGMADVGDVEDLIFFGEMRALARPPEREASADAGEPQEMQSVSESLADVAVPDVPASNASDAAPPSPDGRTEHTTAQQTEPEAASIDESPRSATVGSSSLPAPVHDAPPAATAAGAPDQRTIAEPLSARSSSRRRSRRFSGPLAIIAARIAEARRVQSDDLAMSVHRLTPAQRRIIEQALQHLGASVRWPTGGS